MKLPRGIERTAHGFRAFVQLAHRKATKRFPPETPISVMTDWREVTRARMRLNIIELARQPATGFRKDAERYLQAVAAMPTYKERKRHIELWIALFGDRPRQSIMPTEIRAQLQAWRDNGLSASACNHRRTALMHLFNVLDADTVAPNPVARVPRFRADAPLPRSLDYETIRAILKPMRPSKSKARLSIIAWTGLPPATLKRIARQDWQGKAVFVPGRKKGKGTTGRVVGLVSEAVKAFKMLDRESGWGEFDTSALNRAFKRAAKKAKVLGVSLYALRHSFITEAYLAKKDIQAAAELAGHADTRQTKRYAMAALTIGAAETLAAFGRRTRQKTRQSKKSA